MNERVYDPIAIRGTDLCEKDNYHFKCFSYSCDTYNITLYLSCILCGATKIITRKYIPRDQRIDRRK